MATEHENYIDEGEAARRVGVSRLTMWKYRTRRPKSVDPIPHIRFGRKVLYDPDQLAAWMAARTKFIDQMELG